MSGWGWPSHDKDEQRRIAACYTEADQPTGCPLCILRAENERLGEALDRIASLYDDSRSMAELASLMYDAACIARAALAEVGSRAAEARGKEER